MARLAGAIRMVKFVQIAMIHVFATTINLQNRLLLDHASLLPMDVVGINQQQNKIRMAATVQVYIKIISFLFMALYWNGNCYCTISFNNTWIQVLLRFWLAIPQKCFIIMWWSFGGLWFNKGLESLGKGFPGFSRRE